uniref:Uncharacterized protein n=1 Tax=Vitis vinifera TaxID=29760 RepID=A5B205_VITVI|nr:hypothetical protein VITISV_029400 [Vitis vinifera]
MIPSRQLNSVKPVRVVKNYSELWLLTNGKHGKKGRFRRAKLRPRLLVASGRLIPSPEIQVSTGKDLLIPRGRAGLEASYRKLLATRFYARAAAYPIGLEASYLSPISRPFNFLVDPMAARKGDLVLYSGDLFPTEARKLPSCTQITFRESKGEAYSSISSSRRSVRFYEASKHSSLALINQEFCRHSLRRARRLRIRARSTLALSSGKRLSGMSRLVFRKRSGDRISIYRIRGRSPERAAIAKDITRGAGSLLTVKSSKRKRAGKDP